MNSFFCVYGSLYGTNVYAQNRIAGSGNIPVSENNLRGFKINFYDSNRFLLYSFFSEAKEFPFKSIKYSLVQNDLTGSGCNACEFVMVKSTIEYDFELDIFDIIEIYYDDVTTPVWSGYISEVPEETSSEKLYKYKAEGFVKAFDRTYYNDTELTTTTYIHDIIDEIIRLYLVNQVKGLKYNAALIESTPFEITYLKRERITGKEILKKLVGMCNSGELNRYEYGVNTKGEFFFRLIDTNVKEDLIFIAGMNTSNLTINKGDYKNVVNKLFIERKADSESGTRYVDEFNDTASQVIYGIKSATVQVPEALDDNDAKNYGIGLVHQKAWVKYKGQVRGVSFEKFKDKIITDCTGLGRLYTQDKQYIDSFIDCETLTGWASSDNTNFAISLEDSVIHEKAGSIKTVAIGGSCLGANIQKTLTNSEDWENVQTISFWIYSNLSGQLLSFCYGKTTFDENETSIYIANPYTWEKKIINVTSGINLEEINIIGFKCLDETNSFTFYVDDFKRKSFGRKYFDLQLVKVEYIFDTEHIVNYDFGTLDFPFNNLLINAMEKIVALENSTKGGT